MNPLAHGPAARRRCRRRTAFLAPATLTLVVIALVTALSLLWVLDDPPPGAAFPDDYCLPTTMQECGCTTGATPPTGQATDDDEVLADEQLDYREEEFTHNGTTSTYRVFDSGIDRSRPVGVVIRLHGDGAYEYLGPGTLDSCLAAVAAAHNMVLVHPLTPSEDLTWWTTLTPNVGWLQALYHEQIAPLERVDADQVWWMGYSGGAELITYGLLPRAGEVVTGGAIMVGGGGAPDTTLETTVPREEIEGLRLHWATGIHDTGDDPAASFDALSAARAGAQHYRNLGFGT